MTGLLRPGNAGSNTAADHVAVLDATLAQIPAEYRHGYPVLFHFDGAGASKALLGHLRGLREQGVEAEFTVGWAVGAREHTAIAALPETAWTAAIDVDGDPREGAAVVELTGIFPAGALCDYPSGTRVIARRERPHPGAQLDLIEERDGWRYTCFATDTPAGPARLARRTAPLARPRGRPHPLRQGHRPGALPLPPVRDQPSLAGLRADRDRPDRLDTNHPAPR